MNFLSAEPHSDFLKIIWDPRKISIVSNIALYWGVLYQGSSVLQKAMLETACLNKTIYGFVCACETYFLNISVSLLNVNKVHNCAFIFTLLKC